jgi:hypothetical protein
MFAPFSDGQGLWDVRLTRALFRDKIEQLKA